VNRQSQWKSQIANAALLKYSRLSRIDHAGNLDYIIFEHDQWLLIQAGAGVAFKTIGTGSA
jgi:hypothetical protein